MISHEHYRKAILVDPKDSSRELEEHRFSCPECAEFTRRLQSFEQRLQRSLRIDVSHWRAELPGTEPVGSPRVTALAPLRRRRAASGWLALAASVVLGVVVVGFWLTVPGYSLAADVVTHMAEEPQAWRTTDVAVPDAALAQVLDRSEVRLRPGAGMVSYASSCTFRGHHVPHLVVQTDKGPVTVMVLPHETIHRRARFDEQGYRGILVPVAGHGSLAVLGKVSGVDMGEVERTAARVLDSIDYGAAPAAR